MSFFAENKRMMLKILRTVFFASLVFYFSYHTVSGEKGIISLMRIEQQVAAARAEIKQINDEKDRLQHKVDMISSNSLDTDLLEEQAKKILGHAKKGEIIYFYN